MEKGAPKCKKCAQDAQGCYWKGISRKGVWKGGVSKKLAPKCEMRKVTEQLKLGK